MPWKNGNPPLYTTWRDMLDRCYNKKTKQYHDYGGRGITVCNEWRHNFKRFQADMLPTHKKGLTIDRRNNNLGYSPSNCRWATRKEQQLNRRVTRRVIIENKEYIAANLAEIAGIKTDCIVERAKQGLSYKQVISKKRRQNLNGFRLGAAISAEKRNARTHCKNGHEYTEANTRWNSDGKYSWRVCRRCAADKELRRRGKLPKL